MFKYYLVALFLIIIDQIIKLLVVLNIDQPIVIINNFFELTYVKNYGVSFSKLEGQMYIILIISTILIALIIYLMHYYRYHHLYIWCLTFILAGAIGNYIDRIFRGFVVDYLSFQILGHKFAIFNFADTMLVCGAITLALIILKEDMGYKK
jgi:signal peptidase II